MPRSPTRTGPLRVARGSRAVQGSRGARETRAARVSRRPAATAALVAVLIGAPLPTASALERSDVHVSTEVHISTEAHVLNDVQASTELQVPADVQAPVDYASGPYADRLCPTTPAAGVPCGLGRTVLAAAQGAGHRDRAVAAGATCEVQSGLWVCFEVRSLLVQRGGTTYGDTFLTPDARRDLGPALLAHEAEHVRQWRLFGPDLSLLYLREGVDACANYFEQQAGLGSGGYDCP